MDLERFPNLSAPLPWNYCSNPSVKEFHNQCLAGPAFYGTHVNVHLPGEVFNFLTEISKGTVKICQLLAIICRTEAMIRQRVTSLCDLLRIPPLK
jgi:hypothetical protein